MYIIKIDGDGGWKAIDSAVISDFLILRITEKESKLPNISQGKYNTDFKIQQILNKKLRLSVSLM